MKEIKNRLIKEDNWSCMRKIIIKLEENETEEDIYEQYDVGWTCGHDFDCCGCWGYSVYRLKKVGNRKYSFLFYGRANV